MGKQKISVSWSGGKDSALTLFKLLQAEELEVVSLHTTFDKALRRVGMHGVPEKLIELQAAAVGLPLEKIYLPQDSTHENYENVLERFCLQQKANGIQTIAYGDIFLQDLKEYRERQLGKVGIAPLFPLWNLSTLKVVEEFVSLGFKTLICCLNAEKLPKEWLGRTIDQPLIEKIARKVDPCGENGEFHTFVYDGPIFKNPIPFKLGRPVSKSYKLKQEEDGAVNEKEINYWFQELIESPSGGLVQ